MLFMSSEKRRIGNLRNFTTSHPHIRPSLYTILVQMWRDFATGIHGCKCCSINDSVWQILHSRVALYRDYVVVADS